MKFFRVFWKQNFRADDIYVTLSFIMSLISLREIAVPASNIVRKKSLCKINVSLFVGFIMLDVSFFALARWYLFIYDGKQVRR